MKIDKRPLLILGLLIIVFAASGYCYESPLLPLVVNKTFISLPAVNSQAPICTTVTSQQDDPPGRSYPTTTTTTSSYVGTASLPTTTTTI